MHDYAGCLHIHSTYSDGDQDVPTILDAAREAGLAYLVLTDHDAIAARQDGWEGWHDGVLLAVGAELHAGHHHCMALGLGEIDGSPADSTAERLAGIKRGGGLAFVVHPRPVHKPLFSLWVPGWSDWHLDTYDGIEIWPYLHDWISDLHLWNFLSHYRRPDRWINGPDPALLRQWDAVGQRRRVVGIGSLDNHARRFPFRRRRLSLFEIFPHRQAFGTVRTHLLSPEPFSGEAGADLQRLYALLAAGRCYVSYDLLGDPAGFCFEGERGGLPIPMGEEAPAGEPVELRARSPVKADIRLLRDGELIARGWGTELESRDRGPGVYRIEVYRDDRPWVFSNPIYLRPPA